VAKVVMTEECSQAVQRITAFNDELKNNGVAPADISEIISNSIKVGEKRPLTTKALLAATVAFPNSLLFSSGMLTANAISAVAQLNLRAARQTLKGTARLGRGGGGDLKALAVSLAEVTPLVGMLAGSGSNAQVYRNALRFMWSTFLEGRASDIHYDVASIAKDFGVTKQEVIQEAQNVLFERFLTQNPQVVELSRGTPEQKADFEAIKKAFVQSFRGEDSIEIDAAARDIFASSYDFNAKHAIFHDPSARGKANSIARAVDFILTTPSRMAIGIDETAKVIFRHQLLSEEVYRDAVLKNAEDASKSVGEYYEIYMKELYGAFNNAYNSVPRGPFGSRYQKVSKGLRVLEGKFDEMFLNREVKFNDIREQALQMTFQRQTSNFKKDEKGNYITNDQGEFIRQPSIIDNIARAKNKTGARYSLGEKTGAFAVSTLMPFVKTPFNIGVESASYLPVVAPFMASKTLREKMAMRGYDTEDLLARQAIGFLIGASLAGWLAQGDDSDLPKITGMAANQKERQRMRNANIPEMSIRVNVPAFGERWVPFGRVEPVAGILGAYVTAHDHLINGDEEGYYDSLAEIYRLTADKQAVAGVIDFINNWAFAAEDEGTYERVFFDYVKSYVATGASDIARFGDVERIAEPGLDQLLQRIPTQREALPQDYALFRDPEPDKWSVFFKMKFPAVADTSALERELFKTGADIQRPNRMFRGVELNSKELSMLRQTSQEMLSSMQDGLAWYITTDEYKQLGPRARGKALMNQANAIRQSSMYEASFVKKAMEEYGPTYVIDFQNRRVNAQVRTRREEEERDWYPLPEPDYSPTKNLTGVKNEEEK